jgi:hypothetical protein
MPRFATRVNTLFVDPSVYDMYEVKEVKCVLIRPQPMCRLSQISPRSCCCDYPLPEAEFLDEIQTKSFPPCYSLSALQHSLRFLFLQTHATSYSFSVQLLYTVKETTISPSLWFKKSIHKPQVWELSRLCPETSTKLYVHEFGFCMQSRIRTHQSGMHRPRGTHCKGTYRPKKKVLGHFGRGDIVMVLYRLRHFGLL